MQIYNLVVLCVIMAPVWRCKLLPRVSGLANEQKTGDLSIWLVPSLKNFRGFKVWKAKNGNNTAK